MLKKTIKSIDFDGNEREEDYYFNITKTEITKLQLSHDGGITKKLERITQSKSAPEMLAVIEEFIDLSYGVKSDNGKYFTKTPEALAEFKSSAAYDEFFMDITSNTASMVAFITGILPADISGKIQQDEEFKNKVKQLSEANK